MKIKIKLSKIVDELGLLSDEHFAYLNIETGEISTISSEELRAAEEEEPLERYPLWQQENISLAKEILEKDEYIALPTKFDVNEYAIMEEFCLSINKDELREIMYQSIKGRGAFRRFRENIQRHGIEIDWYKFRDEAMKQLAIEWCEENEIECEK